MEHNGLGDWLEGQRKKTGLWLTLLLVALGLLVLANVFVHPTAHEPAGHQAVSVFMEIDHPHFGYDVYPGFWAVFGFCVAVFMTVVLKKIAFPILGRSEDMYDRDE